MVILFFLGEVNTINPPTNIVVDGKWIMVPAMSDPNANDIQPYRTISV